MNIESAIVLTKIKNTKLNLAPLSKGIIWVQNTWEQSGSTGMRRMYNKVEGKVIPVQVWTDPEGSGRLRFISW